MAPLKPVRSLYDLCTSYFLSEIQTNKLYPSNLDCLRKRLVTYIPGTVRNYIIGKAVSQLCGKIPSLLNIVAILGDPAIKSLNISKRGDCLNWYYALKIFSILNKANIIGLNELDIKVRGNRDEYFSFNQAEPMAGLYKALKKGLASNLRVLVLHSGADNETLGIIGKYAVQLTHLEITCSWLVDDSGIARLLVKDYENVMALSWTGVEAQTAVAICSRLSPSELNKTCETLCEVRIQDTNTSYISVILLLLFARNLKSFGGFLYDRNIGDIVLDVQSLRNNSSRTFALTKLWDMDLPPAKLERLLKLLPKLSHLYTRTVCLLESPSTIPQLTELTADFGLVHYDFQFFNFLETYGKSIRRLVLLDQVYGINLATIAESCPMLEELTAQVYVDNPPAKANSLLGRLRFAEIRICSPQAFAWLMKQADNIKHLEVMMDQKNGVQELFESSVITKLVEERPKSLGSITQLGIHIMMRTIYERLAFSCGMLHIDAAYTLCRECSSLNILGELETWTQVSDQDVYTMVEHIKKCNWNVKLRYRKNLYPAS